MMGIQLSASNFHQGETAQNWKTGFHLSFLNGINTKYDYIISIGSLPSPKYLAIKDTANNRTLLLESSITLQRRFIPFDRKLHVVAAVALHGYYLDNRIYPGISMAPGADLRINANTKLQLLATYLLNHSISNSYRVQLGLYGALKKRKPTASSPTIIVLPATSDRERDGIADEAGDRSDTSGLPAISGYLDTDQDGIPDEKDSCVTVPGLVETNGCPVSQTLNKAPKPEGLLSADSATTLLNFVAKNIVFANNEYAVAATAKPYLSQIVYILGRIHFDTLYITGHTDNIGSSEDNQLLSERRAESVKHELLTMGVPAGKLLAGGKGEALPIADNSTPAGRHLNRRTEFWIKNAK